MNTPESHSHATFHCKQTLDIIKHQIDNINVKSEILRYLLGLDTQIRKKRGLINGLSYALNWLTGTPDADDAEYYTESIRSLLNDNKQTQTLLKSQIQIISSTIRNFNHSASSLKRNEEQLNRNVGLINKLSKDVSKDIDKLKVESLINHHITTLSTLVNEVNNEYDTYIESINLGTHGILSPQVITPKILYDELINYKGEHELPMSIEYKNIHLLFKLLEVQIIYNNDILIYALKLPLVDKTAFNLYHLIPLPIQHKNHSIFSYIEPKSQYLLLSKVKISFTLLRDLTNCIEYLDKQYICKNVHTNKRTEIPTCEVQLLSPHIDSIPNDCQTKNIKAVIETWKYIGTNQWIYVLQKPTTLTQSTIINHETL
ncbi:Baculovirus F protein [Popillia japonica]|uniref:Baculovirus F protein n=1 Tax=Popillia japonica TaxID=7064 RepID=A0AAW1IC57_POPJA